QPDVESAKVAARAALAESSEVTRANASGRPGTATVLAQPEGSRVETPDELASTLREMTPKGGYLAVQAYVDPQGALREPLERLRATLAASLGLPVALGYGPSYLHSVGQLHKGGPALGAFLQFTDPVPVDLPIAKSESSFGTLITAQARGDRNVLIERGRP